MEKIMWILNDTSYNKPGMNNMSEVNKLLQKDWRVKLISSCTSGDHYGASHVYIVLEN